jgi:ATP adenylyltransferase
LDIEMANVKHRFCRLFERATKKKPPYDQILADIGSAVVVATLGSIIPNWLLLIPKMPALNFRSWQDGHSEGAMALLQEVSSRLGIEESKLLWFEHGAATAGSTTGCGVDYAHLHLIIDPDFTFEEFRSAVFQLSQDNWNHVDHYSPYAKMSSEGDYYVFGQGQDAYASAFTNSLGSQFFRRVIAGLAGKENEWDYKTFPHLEHVDVSVRNFSMKHEDAA